LITEFNLIKPNTYYDQDKLEAILMILSSVYVSEQNKSFKPRDMSKEEQKMVNLMEKVIADYKAEISTAWSRGERCGEEKGIRALIRLGYDDTDIAKEIEVPEIVVSEIRAASHPRTL